MADLASLVSRLEVVTSRLEKAAGVPGGPGAVAGHQEVAEVAQSVHGFDDILHGSLQNFLKLSATVGGHVAHQARLVEDAFRAQRAFLSTASQCRQPDQTALGQLLSPTSAQISAIQDFREKNRTSPLFSHLSAVSESISALGWVTVAPAPCPYIKEMNDAGQFYTNRVLKDWKEKDKTHVDWVKAWIHVLHDLQAFVKEHHTTGLVWNPSGRISSGPVASGPSGGGAPPPPPPPPSALDLMSDAGAVDDRAALLAALNQGTGITKGLKKVTADMQTHKNPSLRTGPAPFRAPGASPAAGGAASPTAKPVDKPPKLALEGKKWLIEYQKNNPGIVIDKTEMNQVVYIYRCQDTVVQVKGKLNSIVMDSCRKSAVVFESVVSSVEFVNCQSCKLQVMGTVPTISIDKTDGCQMYLSQDSLNVQIFTAKSSEMNVLVPKGDGDFAEHALPEQFKTTWTGSSLSTTVSEST